MITVNDVTITEDQLLAEVERHQSEPDPMMSAGHELVLRELLMQRARELGIEVQGREAIFAVLEAEVASPRADQAACRRSYAQPADQFREGDQVDIRERKSGV